MPRAIAFDSLAYVKKLKAVGVPEEEAEIHAQTFNEIIEERLANKQDILILQRDMKKLETSLRRDMKELEISLKRDMKDLELRLTLRLGATLTARIIILATLAKLL